MEDALVPSLGVGETVDLSKVLILVLMEDALVLEISYNFSIILHCLNPCFNGRCTRTAKLG